MLISSCSFGESEDKRWAEQFNSKLKAGNVQEVKIGLSPPVALTREETNEVIKIIQQAELEPFDLGTSYGAKNSGPIIFKDMSAVELVIFGPSGGIEIHPAITKKKFKILSDELEYWFRNHQFN